MLDRLLEEEHIAIRGISVTSVGAVNAPIMADGYGRGGLDAAKAELHRFWESVSQYGAISPYHWSAVGFGWSPLALWFDVSSLLSSYKINTFNIDPLHTVLAKTTGSERLRCCASVKLYISATSTNTNRLCVFTAPELSIETLLASICLPQLRQAVEINGGYMGNPVLETLVRFCKSNDIIIVQINPNRRDGLLSTAPQFGDRVNEITFDASL